MWIRWKVLTIVKVIAVCLYASTIVFKEIRAPHGDPVLDGLKFIWRTIKKKIEIPF